VQYSFGSSFGPQLDDMTASAEETAMKTTIQSGVAIPSPVTHMRALLEDYIRQAHEAVDVHVFECLCWTEFTPGRPGSNEPNVCIPFVCSIEIGVFVQAAVFSRQIPPDGSKRAFDAGFVPTYAFDERQRLKVKASMMTI
jgi:hypothetical protein